MSGEKLEEKLVDVYRGQELESSHNGHIAVVNFKGELLYSVGDSNRQVFARSSMKPIQAIPVVESGAADQFNLSDQELSVCTASHSGEARHRTTVLGMLQKAGLGEDHLKCGTHIPRDQESYKELIRAGKELSPVFNNCSGKHAGMLLTAKQMNESLEDYYLLDHPVQQRILTAISEVTDYPVQEIKMGVDGCGVPVHAMPLERIAYGYARMTKPEEHFSPQRTETIKRIVKAMMSKPEMVGGENRFCTDFMKVANGMLFGKAGAEAVYCIGDLRSGIGIAIKIEDGNGRAMYPAAVEVLKQLDLLTEQQIEALKSYHYTELKNARQEVVGKLVPAFSL